jgi:DNA-binding transcriptional ArsR family regulator
MLDTAETGIEELQRHAADASRLLRMMSNERRLLVLCLLASNNEMSVGAIADKVGLSQSALSQHLALLREDGLVATRREGTVIHYRLADERAAKVLRLLHDLYCPELA